MEAQTVTPADLGFLLGQESWLKSEIDLSVVVEDLWRRWNEPHRYWHGPKHLDTLLTQAAAAPEAIRFPLILAIVFHDSIYDPRRTDNEVASANLFRAWAAMSSREKVEEVALAIEDTASGVSRNSLGERLIGMDRRILSSVNLGELLAWENDIAREYQYVSWPEYVAGRSDFLVKNRLISLADYVKNRRPSVGLYAGSFDPFHQGHFNILSKAEKLFDKITVAVGINPEKLGSAVEARLAKVRQTLPFHEVVAFSGLLTSLVEKISSYADVTLIRGLRDGYDLQQEINQARFLEDLAPDIRLVWIPCDRRYQHVSSTAIRSLAKFDPGEALSYLPNQYAYATGS